MQRVFHSALLKYELLLSKVDDDDGSCRSATNNFLTVGGGVGRVWSQIFYAKQAYINDIGKVHTISM